MTENGVDYAAIFDAGPTPAAILDVELTFRACNAAYEAVCHRSRAELIGRSIFDVFPGGDEAQKDILQDSFRRVLKTGEPHHITSTCYDIIIPDGKTLSRHWTASNVPLFSPGGELSGILHCPLDTTELVRANAFLSADTDDDGENAIAVRASQTALSSEGARLQQLFHQAPGFICVLEGPRHIYELANDAYYQLVGHREIIGHPLAEVLSEVVFQGFLEKLDKVYQTGEPFIGRAMPIQLQRVEGAPLEQRYIDLIYQPIFHEDHEVTGIFVQGNDVTEAYTLAQEVAFQAAHDALTGLYNRREFERRTLQIDTPAPHALLYMDIDHFKIINDRCGHAAGDGLLKEVARVLSQIAGDGAFLARLGGDEFALLMPACSSEEAVAHAHRLRGAVKAISFVWKNKRYGVTLSVGVAMFSEKEGSSFQDALGLADAACFLAKEFGRDKVKLAWPSDEDIGRQLTEMDNVTRLQEAIRDDRIVLYGQRIVDIVEPTVSAVRYFEILSSLQDAEGRIIPPSGFIPAAERFGMIEALDRHVVAKAFAHFAGLPEEIRGFVGYFINLSGITLGSLSFHSFIEGLLAEFPSINAAQICFEVTETGAISDVSRSAESMKMLSLHGFRFALDDFGSGMASFAYLQQLPVQFVKIDGAFVKAMLEDPSSSIIVESVVRLANCMGIKTIAESVETPELLAALQPIGAHYAQGFELHMPEQLDSMVHGIQ
ncbi:hypothetical protein GCM10011385_37110 [Nitratireductor aestuarii]|uniref:Uncharacterized protein n=1 Tax=Nitratireductor aestuarii TaxID=1735103 RepID=A0A916W9N1_9HYPH|nr:GGDEF and EAL domain-containing protein [Nitratireductor aestuarii]GGA79472.1 hypothetical protein GCM10011385_37110 [Nitratireductor aestuarii]